MVRVDINTLTMEQYLALSRENQAPGVVKPKIKGNVNFEIKSQFMRELKEETFSGNKNEDTHDHVDRVLNIAKEWWYDYWLEEDEKLENRDKKYDPPKVHLETFEVTRYSFDNGNRFICVTNKIKDTLSLGRENGSRLRKMIRLEINLGEGAYNET
nr:hypothetical protein [Tanacetum cinerariifolium]